MRRAPPQVRIVLVRPRNPLNLLAAARAAANFGFDDVVVVSPYEPVWEEARASLRAAEWLRQARRVATLSEAIGDRNWVLGTSCLSRRRIEPQRILGLEALKRRAAAGTRDRLALLFGSEKRGLTNQELQLCHGVVRIPTSDAAPSMNLGQAVAVCCYELRDWRLSPPAAGCREAAIASAAQIERVVEELSKLFSDGDGTGAKGALGGRRRERLRQLLMRAPLQQDDVALLLGVLRDLAWRIGANRFPDAR